MTDVCSLQDQAPIHNSQVAKDRFTIWPIVVFYFVIFGPLLVGRFWAQDDFTGLLVLFVSLVAALVLVVVYVLKWHWKRSLSVVVAPVIAGTMVVAQTYLGFDVQWSKFQIARPYYLWSVRGLDRAVFEWPEHGVFLGGGWNETLIYDLSDRIMTDQKSNFSLAKYSGDKIEVRNMGGHFYLVTSTYGMD